ncbi:hypothetical protein H0H87_012039 [Tephrocybe sp. NHM501043]|nr:hypothetical protein H0H87_012039 [Tephrocybe sp. NHM501043]
MKIDYEAFAQEWNRSADGKERFYITTEVLAGYAKTWEKVNNIRASQELIADKLDLVSRTRDTFAALDLPFPPYLADNFAVSTQPSRGVIDFEGPLPLSLSTNAPVSVPRDANAAVFHSSNPPPPFPEVGLEPGPSCYQPPLLLDHTLDLSQWTEILVDDLYLPPLYPAVPDSQNISIGALAMTDANPSSDRGTASIEELRVDNVVT